MANVAYTRKNRAPDGTVSGGAYASTLPLSNAINGDLAVPAQTLNASTTSTQIVFRLAQVEAIRFIGLARHNMSRNAQIRAHLYWSSAQTASTVVASTGLLSVFPVAYDPATLPWHHPSFWDGKPTEREINQRQRHWGHLFESAGNVMSGKIEIFDNSNSDGYVRFGELFVCEVIQPRLNMDFGPRLGRKPGTTSDTTPTGRKHFYPQAAARTLEFTLSDLTPDEMLQGPFEANDELDLHQVSYVMFDPGDSRNSGRTSFFARLTRLEEPITFNDFDVTGLRLSWEEVL